MKSISIFIAAIFLLIVTSCIVSIRPRHHLVIVEESEQQHYVIQSCSLDGCRLFGYRYDVNDKGLKEAEETYHFFDDAKPKQTIIATIE